MQKAFNYLKEIYHFHDIDIVILLKEEINFAPNKYLPNPLIGQGCTHIRNEEYTDQPFIIEKELQLIEEQFYSTCYLIQNLEVIWDLPLLMKLDHLWINPRRNCNHLIPKERNSYASFV